MCKYKHTSDTATASEFSLNTNAAQSTSITLKSRNNISPSSSVGRHATNISSSLFPVSTQTTIDPLPSISNTEEMEIKPGIAEMIREEERVSVNVNFCFLFYLFKIYPKRLKNVLNSFDLTESYRHTNTCKMK